MNFISIFVHHSFSVTSFNPGFRLFYIGQQINKKTLLTQDSSKIFPTAVWPESMVKMVQSNFLWSLFHRGEIDYQVLLFFYDYLVILLFGAYFKFEAIIILEYSDRDLSEVFVLVSLSFFFVRGSCLIFSIYNPHVFGKKEISTSENKKYFVYLILMNSLYLSF